MWRSPFLFTVSKSQIFRVLFLSKLFIQFVPLLPVSILRDRSYTMQLRNLPWTLLEVPLSVARKPLKYAKPFSF
jgi:hypothetical protein